MNRATFFDYPTIEQSAVPASSAFLAGWSHSEWTKFFRYCQTLRFSDGDLLIAQGTTERAFYLVAHGQFEMLASHTAGTRPQRISVIEAGAVVGEQTFLDNQPSPNAVRAVGEAEAMRFSHDAFEILAARDPEMARAILFDLGRLVSLRLRALVAGR